MRILFDLFNTRKNQNTHTEIFTDYICFCKILADFIMIDIQFQVLTKCEHEKACNYDERMFIK